MYFQYFNVYIYTNNKFIKNTLNQYPVHKIKLLSLFFIL
uniref:Uncharacterized protein n=1 Tax=viral metagenome TaxID=1070528 RepID=A0A6C0EYH9_9ZZZZ